MKIRIITFCITGHCKSLLTPFVVCFWNLIERLDLELVAHQMGANL